MRARAMATEHVETLTPVEIELAKKLCLWGDPTYIRRKIKDYLGGAF